MSCSPPNMAVDDWCGGGAAALSSALEEHGSDGEDGVEGQSFGEQHSDSVHHQQVEVQLGFLCTGEKK